MPILNQRPAPLPPQHGTIQKTQLPVITDPEYRGVAVDTRYTNYRALLTRIAGSQWLVRYYQQILGNDTELTPQQLDKQAVYQQYREISELELRVTTPLASSQTLETREFQVTGQASTYPPLIPNVGDMFLADIGDGREGLFAITASTRLSILTDACYELEYILVSEADETHRRDLEKKTIQRTHFVHSILEQGGNPFLATEDYQAYRSLEATQHHLLGYFLSSFFNKRVSTLTVPDQTHITYDPYLVEAVTRLVDTDAHPILRVIKKYSVQLPNEPTVSTFWDALLQTDIDRLPLCHEKLALVDAKLFGSVPQYEGVYYSQIEDVVYPIDRHSDLLFEDFVPGTYSPRDIRHQFVTNRLGALAQLTKPKGIGLEALYPIHPVTKDSYYVFTEAFYFSHREKQSQLETLTRLALEGGPIDRVALVRLCEAQPRWGRLEQFYYTPILIALLKVARQQY
jgi:hypothetical protein